MTRMILQSEPPAEDGRALCGRPAEALAAVHLVVEDGSGPVCHTCARNMAPSLAALLRLAGSAERVGRIGRHTVFPPMTALLELARAAESYAQATPVPLRQAG